MAKIDAVTIVLVEDNAGHARLIEKNLRRAHLANPITKFEDGQMALDYFFGEEGYVNAQSRPPILILLDLNLPVVDGYRVMEKLKTDERTKHIPIIILTTTDDVYEVNRCYALGCNIFVTKPVEYDQFADAVAKLGLMLSVVLLPDGD